MRFIYFVCLLMLLALSAYTQKEAVPARTPEQKTVSITELSVDVEGGTTVVLKASDLGKLPRKDVKAKDHDGVEGTYSGVELKDILQPRGAKFGKDLKGSAIAQYLVVEAADGYQAVYSVTELDQDFTDKVVILADTKNGKPLDPHDGLWQIVATNEKKHARWVRQVTALKVRLAK